MFEMLALFVGYFLYESDANNWWFTAYWIIVGLRFLEQLGKAHKELKAKHEKEVEEARKYWEGNDHSNVKGF
jgi:accessory gene regulator protein AgrB